MKQRYFLRIDSTGYHREVLGPYGEDEVSSVAALQFNAHKEGGRVYVARASSWAEAAGIFRRPEYK